MVRASLRSVSHCVICPSKILCFARDDRVRHPATPSDLQTPGAGTCTGVSKCSARFARSVEASVASSRLSSA